MEKKKVLITGANSYIGTSFENHAKECFDITTVDMLNDDWKTQDWSSYDTIFHVAGIVHNSTSKNNAELYFKINRDLAIEIGKKAKENGVKQMVFLSTQSVYGEKNSFLKSKSITTETPLAPDNLYGQSKLQAEVGLKELESEDFTLSIIRPPMVYGKGCKGNFPRLISLAKKAFIFPKLNNYRSMIYIDNLCEFVQLAIENKASGTFFPQNSEYLSTTDIVKTLRKEMDKKTWTSIIFNIPVIIFYPFIGAVRKMFGNSYYDKEMSNTFDNTYQIIDTEKSIKRSL